MQGVSCESQDDGRNKKNEHPVLNNQNRIILSAIGNLSDEELVEIMEAVVYEWRARLNELLSEDNEKDESGRE